jgi:hypothetical protein
VATDRTSVSRPDIRVSSWGRISPGRTCTFRWILALSACALALSGNGSARAYQELHQALQPETRGPDGKITVEGSVIHVVACNGEGETGNQIYVYQYLARPTFRAILPPDWATPLGGQDFDTYDKAAAAGCGGAEESDRVQYDRTKEE